MRIFPPLVACLFAFTALLAATPTASADCVDRNVPNGYGGVVGMTYQYAAESANAACEPDVEASTYTELFCVWLWGVSCADIPAEAIGIANFECRWLTNSDCL